MENSTDSLVAQMVTRRETQLWSLGQEDPLEKEMAAHSSILAGKPHEQRSLAGYSPWGRKKLDMTKQLHFHYGKQHRGFTKNY